MNKTKNIIIFYFIVLASMLISSIGAYILVPNLGLLYASISLITIPIITVITIIFQHIKGSK